MIGNAVPVKARDPASVLAELAEIAAACAFDEVLADVTGAVVELVSLVASVPPDVVCVGTVELVVTVVGDVACVGGSVGTPPGGGPAGELGEAALAGVMDTTCTSGTVQAAATPTTAPRLIRSRRLNPDA
jgi:hypothetical protein